MDFNEYGINYILYGGENMGIEGRENEKRWGYLSKLRLAETKKDALESLLVVRTG